MTTGLTDKRKLMLGFTALFDQFLFFHKFPYDDTAAHGNTVKSLMSLPLSLAYSDAA
jgi:hypothetical protein